MLRASSILVLLLPPTLMACGNKIDGGNGDDGGDVDIIDIDQDGYAAEDDCDDGDASVNPGATEICDDIDNDCNGLVDDNAQGSTTWYADNDNDGYGDDDTAVEDCEAPDGMVAQGGDCDDSDDRYHPGAVEDDCTDPADYNCDGSSGYADADSDGFAACEDCNDGDGAVHPGANEVCNDIDDDCDSLIDADDDSLADGEGGTWYTDVDGDGYGDLDSPVRACEQPDDAVDDWTDCDDGNSDVNPAATEVCNDIDDDCDSLIDSADDSLDASSLATWYTDDDGDGYGDPGSSVDACDRPKGMVGNDDDCDDGSADINPDGVEVCDDAGADEDCDGFVNDDDPSVTGLTTWYIDYDDDGYGNSAYTDEACAQPEGYVASDTDCDDIDADINPGAAEVCDGGIDNDCNLLADDDDPGVTGTTAWHDDSDGDGFGDPDSYVDACIGPDDSVADAQDCDDGDPAINPDATEICDGGIDNDCNDLADGADPGVTGLGTWYADSDEDGFGDPSISDDSCDAPDGYVDNADDCDDGLASVNPDADELCNGADDDCDDEIDEDAVDGNWSAVDDDGDGFGAPGSLEWTCDSLVDNDLDCDDDDPDEPVFVSSSTGSVSGAGSIDDPLDTIQAGIDAAYVCVVVDAGTYAEALDFSGKDIAVVSLDGAESTIVDASGLGLPAVSFDEFETDDAILDGFTLMAGDGSIEESSDTEDCTSVTTCTTYTTSTCGGGVYLDGAGPTLRNLVLLDNILPEYSETTSGDDTWLEYSFGGGLCALGGAAPELDGVRFEGNFADQGGGLYVDESSSVVVQRSWFIGNEATDGAAIQVDGGDLQLDNVGTLWNVATDDAGSILAADGNLAMTNVTLAGDGGGLSGAVYVSGTTSADLDNSIVYTDSSLASMSGDGSATVTATYSNVYNATGSAWSSLTDPTGSSGNISSDPMFADWTDDGDPSNDDVQLDTGSPSKNTGNPDTAYNDPDGTRNDMGIFGGPGSEGL